MEEAIPSLLQSRQEEMILEKEWLDKELRKDTPATDMPLALSASRAEDVDEKVEAVEALDIEHLFHRDLGHSPLLEREEERLLTQKAREAWQTILHRLEEHPRLTAVFLGEKEIKYDSLGEGDILRLLESLRERMNKPDQGRMGAPMTEEVRSVLTRVQEALLRFHVYRDELVRRNLPLVLSIARRYQGQSLSYLDLIQEGVLGLLRAIEKFDPDQGVKFITYAAWWVWQAMALAQDRHGRNVVRTSAYVQVQRRRLSRIYRTLEGTLHRAPTREELFAAGREKIKAFVFTEHPVTVVSLDVPVGEDGDRLFKDMIPDTQSLSPEEMVIKEDTEENLHHVLQRLAPRDAEILRLRFGLSGDRVLTLEEIGSRLGVTRERVRQLEERALVRLKGICQEDGGVEAWV
jgi:RNA polymerase primary sigma factor